MRKLALFAFKHMNKLVLGTSAVWIYNKIDSFDWFGNPLFTSDGKELKPIQMIFNFLLFFSIPFLILYFIFRLTNNK